MDEWPDRLKLLSVLSTTLLLLENSEHEGWGLESPKETAQELSSFIKHIHFERRQIDILNLKVLFMVTGPIHEIAMQNG